MPNHPTVADAARNNAEWCAAMCASHGVPSSFGTDAWAAHLRSPDLYPDTVTLEATTTVGQLLPRVDAGPDCSIKDSFATLEHLPPGFRILFEAEWIGREPASTDDATKEWTPITDANELRSWEAAWADDDAPTDLFRPALLDDPAVVILAERVNQAIVAGAVLNRAAGVVGVSNFFTNALDREAEWANAIASTAAHFPDAPLVGYERGDDLAAALRNGFVAMGPLRVWINDA